MIIEKQRAAANERLATRTPAFGTDNKPLTGPLKNRDPEAIQKLGHVGATVAATSSLTNPLGLEKARNETLKRSVSNKERDFGFGPQEPVPNPFDSSGGMGNNRKTKRRRQKTKLRRQKTKHRRQKTKRYRKKKNVTHKC